MPYHQSPWFRSKPSHVTLWDPTEPGERDENILKSANIRILEHVVGPVTDIRLSHPEFPILIGSTTSGNAPLFQDAVSALYEQFGLEADPLHFSALLNFGAVDLSGIQRVVGYPGSGNTIIETLRLKIHELAGVGRPVEPEAAILIDCAEIYQKTVRSLIKGIFPEPRYTHLPEKHIASSGYLYMVSNGPDILEIIYRNPMHISSTTQLLHQFFSYDELEFYKSCRIKLLLAVRNPLDVILSNSNKINFGNPAPVISNLPWFESLSENIRNYYLRYMQILDEFFVMKYEDLMGNPSKEIDRLAGFLDMSLDDATIGGLWQQWGNKKIGEGGGHFWQPGAGKWRRYFTKDHLSILRRLGYESLLGDFGYDSSGLTDHNGIAEHTESTPLPETSFLINDYHMQRFHGKNPVTNIGRFKADLFLLDRCNQSGHPYMRVYCSPGMRNTLLENDDFSLLCQVLASM